MNTQRPLPVAIATVLLAILSLGNLLSPVILSEAGSAVYVIVVLGVFGLAATGGLWMLKRWALWLSIVVSILNILAAAPGLVFAPDPMSRALATVGVVGFGLIILLVVLPNSRRAYA